MSVKRAHQVVAVWVNACSGINCLPLSVSVLRLHRRYWLFCFVQKSIRVKTIMLVDDSATLLLSVSTILTKAGYQVEKASNAQEGLRKFASGIKVDLLITDLNMPGMNGIEFIREVRKLPNYRFMPILFQTTESQQSKRLEAKAAGASGWLVKPVTATDLLNTIKLVMR